jgi:hypothetical protein
MVPITAAICHRKPASAGTSSDSGCPQGHDKRNILYVHIHCTISWAHLYQKKATGVNFPTHVLDSGQKIGARTDKLLLYKTILKPILTYGVTLWGTACHSNIEILQRFQNKVLRTLANAPWYIPVSYTPIYTCQPFGTK